MSAALLKLSDGLDKANREAAERIMADPERYAGVMTEWAERVLSKSAVSDDENRSLVECFGAKKTWTSGGIPWEDCSYGVAPVRHFARCKGGWPHPSAQAQKPQ